MIQIYEHHLSDILSKWDVTHSVVVFQQSDRQLILHTNGISGQNKGQDYSKFWKNLRDSSSLNFTVSLINDTACNCCRLHQTSIKCEINLYWGTEGLLETHMVSCYAISTAWWQSRHSFPLKRSTVLVQRRGVVWHFFRSVFALAAAAAVKIESARHHPLRHPTSATVRPPFVVTRIFFRHVHSILEIFLRLR